MNCVVTTEWFLRMTVVAINARDDGFLAEGVP